MEVHDFPLDLLRFIVSTYLLYSPYSDTNYFCRDIYRVSCGKYSLRSFLSCCKRLRNEIGPYLIYFDLRSKHSVRFVTDQAFHDRVISLVVNPKLQIGLHFGHKTPPEPIPEDMIKRNSNHIHALIFGEVRGHQEMVQHFPSLDDVQIMYTDGVWKSNDPSNFASVYDLSIICANTIPDLDEGMFQKIRFLRIDDATNVTRIPALPLVERLELTGLKNLKTIDVAGCPNLKELQIAKSDFHNILNLRNISTLFLGWLTDITDISCLTGVVDLTLSEVPVVTGWEALQANCEKLKISRNWALKSFKNCRFQKLKMLHLSWCHNFVDLSEVNQVEELKLKHCGDLADLSPLRKGVGNVKKISLSYCLEVTNFSPLNGIPEVKLDGDLRVTVWKEFGNHEKSLKLYGFNNLKAVPLIKNIRCLEIAFCFELKSLGSKTFSQLKKLIVEDAKQLTKLPVLPNLEHFELCGAGISLFDTDNFPNLKFLRLTRCEKLQAIILRQILKLFEVNACPKLMGVVMKSEEQKYKLPHPKEEETNPMIIYKSIPFNSPPFAN
jgi:hypothetical protein